MMAPFVGDPILGIGLQVLIPVPEVADGLAQNLEYFVP
jgi:hypothetical protein